MAKRDVLKANPFFKGLTDAELAAVEPIIQEKTLPPGTTLFLEGMVGESMYIIASGNIKISKMIEEGHEQVLMNLGPGNCFGEMAILDRGPRSASAVSTIESKILTLRRKDFIELGRSKPDLALKILWNLVADFSKRMREIGERYGKLLAQASGGAT